MRLDQGHNAVKPVRLEPTAHQSRVKHSTTKPLSVIVAFPGHIHLFTLNLFLLVLDAVAIMLWLLNIIFV